MAYRPRAIALGLIIFLAMHCQSVSAFTIAVSPARIEVALTARPKTKTIKVVNYGKEATSVAVRVAHFDLDENNKVREIAPTPQSLDQWLIVRPLKVKIPPGKTATIRFAIRPLTRPAPGEHRAIIFLEQHDAKLDQPGNRLNIGYRIGVAVYAYASPKRIQSKLHAIAVSKSSYSLDVESLGNSHSRITGMFGLWPKDKYPGDSSARASVASANASGKPNAAVAGSQISGKLPSLPVLPGYRRKITKGWRQPLKSGLYRFVAVGAVGEAQFTRVLPVEIK